MVGISGGNLYNVPQRSAESSVPRGGMVAAQRLRQDRDVHRAGISLRPRGARSAGCHASRKEPEPAKRSERTTASRPGIRGQFRNATAAAFAIKRPPRASWFSLIKVLYTYPLMGAYANAPATAKPVHEASVPRFSGKAAEIRNC